MRSIVIFLLSLGLITALLSFAYAEDYSQKIKKIGELYDNMEYEKCLKEITQLESYKYSMNKEELLEIYKYKAFIYILSDRKALAESVIKEIYEIDPDFTLSPSISPKLREPFARIKKGMKKEEAPKEIKEEKPKTWIIEATPVKDENIQKISKEAKPVEKENFFKKNIIPISIVSAGVVLFVPGLVVRMQAASDADDYRKKLESAPRDELGNIIGITKEDAQKKQDDVNSKVMIGNTLMITGVLAIAGGVTTYFILNKDKGDKRVSINFSEDGIILTGKFNF
jgi:hypothetical protein